MRRKRRNRFPRPQQAGSYEGLASTEALSHGKPEAAGGENERRSSQKRLAAAAEIFDMLLHRARNGDAAAAKIILDRERPVAFELRAIETRDDVGKAIPEVWRAISGGTLLISEAETIVKLLAKSAGLLKLAKEEPGPILTPKINIMFGREDGRHNGREFADEDRRREREEWRLPGSKSNTPLASRDETAPPGKSEDGASVPSEFVGAEPPVGAGEEWELARPGFIGEPETNVWTRKPPRIKMLGED